jgi:DnaJ homolog subfamily C member 3
MILLNFNFMRFLLSDGDKNNYMSFYKRGTVYLAMGKFKSALTDLTRVIELKPDFVGVS